MLRSQVRGGKIFGAFNEQEREHILTKLLSVNGLIPSLHTFFKDLQYLQACVDCVKRLISLSPGQTLFNAMECAFTGINQRDGQVMLQIAESEFIYRPSTVADQVSLGYQQIHAHAMRNFLATPKEPQGENIRAIPKKEADKAVLRKFAELAQWLGFESLEITTLKEYLHSTPAAPTHTPSKPVLVTSGRGEIKSRRCGLPRKQTYEEDSEFLISTISMAWAMITAKGLRLSSSAGRSSLHSTAGTSGPTRTAPHVELASRSGRIMTKLKKLPTAGKRTRTNRRCL